MDQKPLDGVYLAALASPWLFVGYTYNVLTIGSGSFNWSRKTLVTNKQRCQ